MPASHGSLPEYDVSMCPLNISVGPPPVPTRVAEHVRAAVLDLLPLDGQPELAALVAPSTPAIASSEPVKLGVETAADASSRRGGRGRSSELRQHPLAEEADLVVPLVAPKLEHDVRAAGITVLLDRLDAVDGRSGDRLAAVEQRVGHLLLRGEPTALLHRLGDGLELLHLDPRQIEQRFG